MQETRIRTDSPTDATRSALELVHRLLASPAPRPVLLAGMVMSAALRSLVPATVLLIVAFSIGAHWPGLDGLALLGIKAVEVGGCRLHRARPFMN